MVACTDLYGETVHHVEAAGGAGAGVCSVALQGGHTAAAGGAGVGAQCGVVGGPGGGGGQHHRLDDRHCGQAGAAVRGWPVADGPVCQPPRVLRLLVGGLSLAGENNKLEQNKTKQKHAAG